MQCPSCHTAVDASQRYCPACGTVLSPAEQAPQDLMVGQTLGGKYRIVRLLGEGGMGAVYEGEQQLGTSKRKVAIKTLHPHLSRDPKIKARFEREVGTVAELEHPNTIQVYDFGTHEDGILYIVMEFLQGKSLAALLEKEGALAPDRVERIMQQVCGSLEEAHERGIVHRDLKPDNIVLVDRAGKKDFVKVLDFGIAKRSNETDSHEQKLTQQGTVLGTPPYMSPEQFSGRPIDARSDIYSLGVMAYEMLTGRLPFAANTPWEWATQHMTQLPIPIESHAEGMRAPAGMRSAIVRALAKAPEERFQTVKSFIDAFAAPASAQNPPPPADAGAVRQKTEIGAPLDVAAAFGPSGSAPAAAIANRADVGGGGAAPRGYGPTEANMALPAPATIPQPPPRDDKRGGGRTTLLIAAGLIGLASVAAIVFAMRGSSGDGKAVVFDQGTAAAPAASLQPVTAPTDTAVAPSAATGGSDVPPLSAAGGGGGGHGPAPRPGPTHVASGGTAPTAPAPTAHAPSANGPVSPPAAKYDGPECQTARRLKALGHPKEAESWASACTAKGGTP